MFYSHFQIFLLSRRSRSHLWYIRKIIIIIIIIIIITETENNEDQLWWEVKRRNNIISCFVFWLRVKYLKSSSTKINYDFLKMPHKEPSQNLSGHAGWRSVSQKNNVIRSPDQYPCLVLGLLYLEQEKKVWPLAFLNYRSSINIANI